jgi:methylmalonyl-CoA mutase N-terminal domain/subunit
VVSVNAFQVEEERELERLRLDPAIEAGQRERLADVRARRDAAKVSELLAQLEAASERTDENLMPLFITCVENDVTLGEICGVLRRQWGEYHPPAWD